MLPLFAVVTIWLHYANKGAGVFFFQKRIGKNGEIFKIIKFKSMTDETDETGKLLADAKRLTKAGRFVRATSIDELPQLFNILKGDMSLIGPRPLPPVYSPYFNVIEQARHKVRPGITGLAQVNGRKSLTWDKKLSFDILYVKKLSFLYDLKILWLTFYKVLKREDIGLETSGVDNFYDFRERQWFAEGKVDLVERARKAAQQIRNSHD